MRRARPRRGLGAGVLPPMALDMAIGETQINGPTVIGSRKLQPPQAIGLVEKIAIIDAVGMLLDKDEDLRWPEHLADPEILLIRRVVHIGATFAELARVSNHRIH